MPHGWLQQLELWLAENTRSIQPLPPPGPGVDPTFDRGPRRGPVLPGELTGIPFVIQRNPRARRYVLRVARDGRVHLTIPRGGTEAFAQRFAIEKASWIREQIQRLAQAPPSRTPWGPGSPVWYRGDPVPVAVHPDHARIADFAFPIPPDGEDWRPSIERHLRTLASAELPPLVFGAAELHHLDVRRVQVRDQRSRWGSCSRQGTISLNWRLVQVPLFVRDYLIAHELAHLRQMNHSRRFWSVVEEFYPAWKEAERWLRENGRRLLA